MTDIKTHQNVILTKDTFVCCRQIQPSDNNVPGKYLSDSANELNRRKLLINYFIKWEKGFHYFFRLTGSKRNADEAEIVDQT